MKQERKLFTSDDIGITCPKDKKWEDMEEVIGGRFCNGCDEKIIYVEGYSKGEVMALQRELGENICVAVNNSNDSSVIVGIPNFRNIELKEEALVEEY